MKNPKVSIIIPVYNVADYIATCIESIITQDYNNIEVLLIDDCTPDNSIIIANQIIDKYNGQIEFKIIHRQTNLRQAAARNTGIRAAKGEYLFFLDSDDKLASNAISKLVHEAVESGADVTTANRKAIDWLTGDTYKMLENDYPKLRVNQIDDIPAEIKIHGTVWNKLIKREFVINNDLFFEEGIVYEDDLWIFKLYCCRPSFSCITDTTYIYHIRQSSTIQTYSEFHFFSRIVVARKAIAYIPHVKNQMLDYAYFSAEGFRQGVLISCLTHIKGWTSYSRIYKYLHQCNISFKSYMASKYVTPIAKFRFLGNMMPSCIGRLWNYIFIKIMLSKNQHSYPYLKSGKIILSPSFWNKLQQDGSSK